MHSRRAFALRKSFTVGLLLPLAALFAGITKALGPQDEEVCAKIAALRKQLGTTVRWQNKQQTELSALRVELVSQHPTPWPREARWRCLYGNAPFSLTSQ